jgi:metal-responsive CopG/Arc/MetJ family transcriptional regulator
MQTITIKVDESLNQEIEKAMKPFYSTKTEFVRTAIVDKIKKEQKENIIAELKKMKGIIKTKTSNEEYERNRKLMGEEILKKFGLD